MCIFMNFERYYEKEKAINMVKQKWGEDFQLVPLFISLKEYTNEKISIIEFISYNSDSIINNG